MISESKYLKQACKTDRGKQGVTGAGRRMCGGNSGVPGRRLRNGTSNPCLTNMAQQVHYSLQCSDDVRYDFHCLDIPTN
nr:hypothetical protein CFP56_72722 [Quercus suber]